jgi:hypothetical protein
MRQFPKNKFFTGASMLVLGLAAISVSALVPAEWNVATHSAVAEANVIEEEYAGGDTDSRATHLPTPEPMYAIYMSQCVVGTPSFRDSLVKLIEETSLNAVVIDVKDYSGTIGIPTRDSRFEDASLVSCGAYDIKEFIERLHEKGIYVIARITVFQDPFYTKKFPQEAVQSISRPGEPWKDYKGLAFVDVSSEPFWDYIVTLSKEAYALGFDELNFDYVRYPSDGPMKDASFKNPNKAEALEKFFRHLHGELKGTAPSTSSGQAGIVMSADLFGYTTVLTDDLGIGQQLERTLPYFDYIAPMVYPSHYNKGFAGLQNPNSDPYKVVNVSMLEAVRRALAESTTVKTLTGQAIFKDEIVPATSDYNPSTSSIGSQQAGSGQATTTKKVATGTYTKEVHSKLKLRPWLQDFDYGKDYRPEDIEAQIRGTYDAGLTSWFFWDPANKYDSLRRYLSEN